MKTTDKRKYQFERRPQYRNFINFNDLERKMEQINFEQFVVPWQMVETKRKYVVE